MDQTFEEWLEEATSSSDEEERDQSVFLDYNKRDGYTLSYNIMNNAEDNIINDYTLGFLKIAKGTVCALPSDETTNILLVNNESFKTKEDRDEYLEIIYLYEKNFNKKTSKAVLQCTIETEDIDIIEQIVNTDFKAFVKMAVPNFKTNKNNKYECDLKGNGKISINYKQGI